MTKTEALARLGRSSFRAGFHLSEAEKTYTRQKGLDVIRSHAADFVAKRLAPAVIPNDGRQTPMRGHPVFVAQHDCACCCRGCLEKWYRVRPGVPLTPVQQEKIVSLLMVWIEKEMENEG